MEKSYSKKIFITGASRGLGLELSQSLEELGHSILCHRGKKEGDLTSKDECKKIIEQVITQKVDIFINNAQCDWSQAFLCFELHKRWKEAGFPGTIVNIGSQVAVDFKTRPKVNLLYDYQKVALKELSLQLSHYNGIRIHHFDLGYFETDRTSSEKFGRFKKMKIKQVEKVILDNLFNSEVYIPYIYLRSFDDQEYAETT
jgi:NAD(P)-dependent dehydrogenase (short-subunit alcohol dehydrogenase family)